MKLWLDDVRPAPDGWAWAKNAAEARALLAVRDVTDVSLDHDLGDATAETGYDVLAWVEKALAAGAWYGPLPTFRVHSANPVGANRMRQAIASIVRLHEEWMASADLAGSESATQNTTGGQPGENT